MLSDSQARIVMAAARDLPPEKADLFRTRVQSWIRIYGASDLARGVELALTGLNPNPNKAPASHPAADITAAPSAKRIPPRKKATLDQALAQRLKNRQ